MDSNPPANIPLLLNAVLTGLNNQSAQDLARLGVKTQSARALIVLLEYSELRCSKLSRLIGLEATALSHLLRALARKHLITRNRVENDNRAVEVRLTEKGQNVAQACQVAARVHERKLLAGLDSRDLRVLGRLLAKMGDNVTPPSRRAGEMAHPRNASRHPRRTVGKASRKGVAKSARARAVT